MSTSQTEADLEKAKQLIQAKRYADAQALLITIDHPKADQWLKRLKEIDAFPPTVPTKSTAPKTALGEFLTILSLLCFAGAVLMVLLMFIGGSFDLTSILVAVICLALAVVFRGIGSRK